MGAPKEKQLGRTKGTKMELTNYERWCSYTSNLSSPQNYVDWGWLYLISAALQRRVWIGPHHQPLYPNMYVILVGAPGIGKGLVIREVSEFLKHWKLKDRVLPKGLSQSQTEVAKAQLEADDDTASGNEFQGKVKNAELIQPGLIPVAADATTYEALVKAVAESYRCIQYVEESPDGQKKLKVQGHSSICFSLQELSSLMRKRTEDTVNYLLGLYDCPVDYEYITLSRGKDRVRRGCLNILAGTTPSFMQTTFDDKLMDEGFASRTFYIFASKNRKNQFWIPPLSPDQERHKGYLLEHIRQLTGLFGNVKMSKEAKEYLQQWWDEQENNKQSRANTSLKLIPYYARKNIHVMKIAMAKHFSESLEMEIPLETFKWAIKFLEAEEKRMSFAISLGGDNPGAKVTKKIMEYLGSGPKNSVEIMMETHHMCSKSGLEEALTYLMEADQISQSQTVDEDDGTTILMYRLKR